MAVGSDGTESVVPDIPYMRRGDGERRATFFELFFDLVYVFAITQLSHGLLEHLGVRGALQTLVLLLAVWWAWVYTAWATNWLDPDSRPVRLVLIGVMAGGLVMAAALPEAFGERGLIFASAYAAIQVGRTAFVFWAFRDHPVQRRNFTRILIWQVAASAVWVAGGLATGTTRELIWLGALIVDYAAPAAAFRVPGLGPSPTTDWTVTGSHFAERFKLFVILALGESVLVTGATFSGLEVSGSGVVALGVAFAGAVTLWWIYFDRSAEAGSGVLASTADPGRLARSAYTYFHLPIVAGIIVTAVADELMITHPDGHADLAIALVTLGGPALFLAGHAFYKWATFGVVSRPRLAAIGVLGAVLPAASLLSPLVLGMVAVLVLLGVAVADILLAHDVPAAATRQPEEA
jgi:low temperature requirement protein LtrA